MAWARAVDACVRAGLPRWMIMVDPGIGFAKGFDQNLELLHPTFLTRLSRRLGCAPVLVGASRKGFIGKVWFWRVLGRGWGLGAGR